MPIDQSSLKKTRSKLEKEQRRLEVEINKLDGRPTGGQSEEDDAQLLEQFQENVALEKSLAKMLADVKKSLSKIKAGSYGICESCRIEINAERLTIYPASVICVNCESKRKKRWWLPWRR